MFLARIVPEKGLHYLIDAFMQTDTDKKLVIAGGVSHSSEYAKQIHDMAKADKAEQIEYVKNNYSWDEITDRTLELYKK